MEGSAGSFFGPAVGVALGKELWVPSSFSGARFNGFRSTAVYVV